jgi:hypothetical protein
MRFPRRIAQVTLLALGLIVLAQGCVVVPPYHREGFYDHDHHRWWHNHAWVACGERDEHCHD